MIALYPGGFKPPHRGHFTVANSLSNNSFKGAVYDYSNFKQVGSGLVQGEEFNVPEIKKVVVFVGLEGRGDGGLNIDQATSEKIWNIYQKHFDGEVEIRYPKGNPAEAAKDYAKQNPDQDFALVTGIRSESDINDLGKISLVKKLDNVVGLAIPSTPETSFRASNLRKAIKDGEDEAIAQFFPDKLSQEEKNDIIKMLKDSIIKEAMLEKVNNIFEEWFTEEQAIEEGTSGAPIAPRSAIRSVDRMKLVTLYNRLRNMISDTYYKITFNQDHIRVELPGPLNENSVHNIDYTTYIGSIIEYMIDRGLQVTPIPEVKVVRDIENEADVFGRTAHYNPVEKEITLYIEGRHPKDVLRSFAHEMIHHKQNLEGRLHNISTTNTNEDDNLLELEKEAYLEGNIMFRNWEDQLKNSSDQVLNENTYRQQVLDLSRDFINEFKENFGVEFEHNSYGNLPGGKTTEFDVDFHVKPVKDLNGHPYSIRAEGDEDSIEIFIDYI